MHGSMPATRSTRIVCLALGAFTLTGCTLGRGYSDPGRYFSVQPSDSMHSLVLILRQ